ncbi:helix-turn-helix transcriptional regulator, partial [Collinsella aerofaciens]|uniref:helix-turn-helix domain-containing protein n=2 Tax=Collinsella aerofaciens TaxID=74426 RepID=UPI00232DF128
CSSTGIVLYSPLAFIQQSMTLFVMDISPLQRSFGLRCKKLRSKFGYSQEQFANRIDMDRSYYASIEVGRRNVSLSNICKIANGFNMSIAALMTGVTDITD